MERGESWRDVEAAIERISGKTILFVTGAVKSGTTWTQLWLDSHPEIACRGEGYFFDKFAGSLQTLCTQASQYIEGQNSLKNIGHAPFPPIGLPQVQHLLRQTVLGCLAVYGGDDETKVVAEKTPSYVLTLDVVKMIFPEAKVLHLVRDGRDVVISTWHHNNRTAGQAFQQLYPTFGTFVPEMADIWTKHQQPALDAQEAHPGDVMLIRYEDLLDRPETVMGDVFRWLGVRDDDDTVRGCIDATDFQTLSGGRKPGQEDRSSFFRTGTAEQWRDVLTDEQRDQFWTIAGDMMTRLGYARG